MPAVAARPSPGRRRRSGSPSAPSAASSSTSARGRRSAIAFPRSSRPTRRKAPASATIRATPRGAARRRARRDRSRRRGRRREAAQRVHRHAASPSTLAAKPSQPSGVANGCVGVARHGSQHREIETERARARDFLARVARRRDEEIARTLACGRAASQRSSARRRNPRRAPRPLAVQQHAARRERDARAARASRANARAPLERPRLVAQLHERKPAGQARVPRGRETTPRRCLRRT